jgi:hypothetical protein
MNDNKLLTLETLMNDNKLLTHEAWSTATFIRLHQINTRCVVFTLVVDAVINVGLTSVTRKARWTVTASGI